MGISDQNAADSLPASQVPDAGPFQPPPMPPSPPVVPGTLPAASLLTPEVKPRLFSHLSVLLFLLFLVYSYKVFAVLAVLLITEHSVNTAGGAFSFLKVFPAFGLVPVVSVAAALIFLFLAFKIRNGSRFSFWFTLGAFLSLPLTVTFVIQTLALPLNAFVSDSGAGEGISPRGLLVGFTDPAILLSAFGSIVLLISSQKFHYLGEPLAKKAKVALVMASLLLVLPVGSILGFKYLESTDSDYGWAQTSAEAGFHLYRPSPVPVGFEYTTRFEGGKELAGKSNAVQAAFDIPLEDLMASKTGKPTVLRQVAVEDGFNIADFSRDYFSGGTPEEISLTSDQTVYYFQKPLGDSFLKGILFLTNDRVLISLMSPRASREELMDFALSLK